MNQSFYVDWKLPGLNDYTDKNRSHKMAGASMKKFNQEVIFYAIRQAGIKPVSSPVKLEYLWIEKDERRDADNIAFAQKFVQDALVSAGVLPNDNRKWVKGFSHDFRIGDRTGVQVTIREA
jgi:Holliday junction resolvase RusA-like endonuclease